MFGHLRYVLMNLLPMCDEHHTKGKAISMHAWGADTKVIANFNAWLKHTLPLHYQGYIENKEDRTPHRLTLSELAEICEDLQYLADHPEQAEKLIYEK